jgi:two-component system phosphate regulon sensor histidine kinase PhoR
MHLSYSVSKDLFVQADADLLEQILLNLIDNAVKYGKSGGTVEVHAVRDGKEDVCISVMDDGPGIPSEARDRIFERFFRVDKARSRSQGGTGLGLSIVKHIAQTLGGRVWVESEVGKGSSFFFTMRCSSHKDLPASVSPKSRSAETEKASV